MHFDMLLSVAIMRLITACLLGCTVAVVLALPVKELQASRAASAAESMRNNKTFIKRDRIKVSDSLLLPTTYLQQQTTLKPSSSTQKPPAASSSDESMTPEAQNYFSTYYQPLIPPLGHSRPYFQTTDEPFLPKYPRHKHYLERPRHQSYTQYETSLMGSGDYGILRGGTFYSSEEAAYHEPDSTDIYYGDASNSHGGSVTEGFIHKYTYPEEQFAQFRDFADLNAPPDTAFSQYVVVYAAKNSTDNGSSKNKIPNNIFDQLQQIDEEKAKEQLQTQKKISPRKLKLVKTKIIKKRLLKKTPRANEDEDPLWALS